jgi:hypothetical protein
MTTEVSHIARTESLFRHVNERIAEVADRLGSEEAEFVCECADADCGERLPAKLDEYEQVREDGARFLVAPGHEYPEYEHVLQRREHMQVVAKSKDPRLAEAARELDPRADEQPPPDQANEMK